MKMKVVMPVACLVAACCSGCLSYSHCQYAKRAEAARTLPDGVSGRPGRIYFASYPENCLDASVFGWHPCVGHASLLTRDAAGLTRQYDYGWFCGREEGERPEFAIGYVDESPGYGAVMRCELPQDAAAVATNDMELAKLVLKGMQDYGNRVELWAKDVPDVGVAERYMEQFSEDENRGSMAWRCWQIGGYRCGNITRQAFDAARSEGHFLDLLWGGFPGADAPSIGTEKTVYSIP